LQAKALEGITLTATQQTTIDSINARYRSQMPAFEPGSPPSDADRQKMRALLAASQKEVRAVLAPDQQAVYDKNIAALQRRFQGGGPAPGAPRNP
jgi:Spy/CpxP family protein refolding chaperone